MCIKWGQKLFDGSVAVFEKVKRQDTVMMIPVTDTEEKKIILVEEEQPGKKPFVGLVGGRVDEGEEVLEAVKRELLEETGNEASKFVLWDAIQPVSKIEWAVYTFIAKGCRKVTELALDSGERIKLRYVSFNDFVEIVLGGNENFQDTEVTLNLMRMKDDSEKMEELRRLFFG